MEACVIYCRKSDDSALPTDVSFDDQEATCRAYAQERGYKVFKVYRESHTGADLPGRPLVWEAMDDIKRGDAQILLVRNYDRLARKPEHQGVIVYEVEEIAKGRVEAALEPVDPDDVMAKTVRSILAVVAEAERLNSVARMERGKKRRAERGHLMVASNPLFGYAWEDDEPGKRTTYLMDEETGPIVIRIFNLAATGQTLRSIARLLNENGIPTPSQWADLRGHLGRRHAGTAWTADTIHRIITDRTYTGVGVAYRWQRVKSRNGKRTVAPRPDGGLPLEVPALVDIRTWEAAQRRQDKTGRPPIDREASWLRGHVYCGVCGARMRIRRVRDGAYEYGCSRQRTSVEEEIGVCPGGNFAIRSHLLDPTAYQELARTVKHLEPLRELMLKRLGYDKMAALSAMAEGFEAQLKDKREELETARRRAIQTRDDELGARFLRDAEQLNDEIRSLEREYADAREQLDDFHSGSAWVDAWVESIRQGLAGRDPTPADIKAFPYEKRRLLLDASGLYLLVSPSGGNGPRIETGWMWAMDPKRKVARKMFGARADSLHLIIRSAELYHIA